MPLSVEDSLALHELYARYAHSFDAGDVEAWSKLFAPGAEFVLPDGTAVTGREALREFVRARTEEAPGMRHLMSNILVEETSSGAHGSAYFLTFRHGGDGRFRLRNFGRYEDEFTRDGDRWLFASRRVVSELPIELVDGAFAFTP